MRMFARNLIRAGFLILPCLLAFLPSNARAQSKEYQLKAAFLFNFAEFVRWPANAFAGTNAPFCIGILGDDPFGAALDQTVQGETIASRKIIIERAKQISSLTNCQVIFISKSEKRHLDEIFSALDSKPVLTVGEISDFAQRGGGINFYLDGTKVRFEINPDAAQKSGLKISSQLLSLGKIVKPQKEEK